MQHRTPSRVEVAGYRDPETGEIDLVVYLDGEEQKTVRWHIFDAASWFEEDDEPEARIPLSQWRAAAWRVASEGSPLFASMITAFSTSDERAYTVNDLHPATDAQPDVTTVAELDPTLWYQAANRTPATTAMSAANAVVALRAFHTAEGTPQEKAEVMLTAFKAALHYFPATLTDTLIALFEALRQFADARDIRLEARPARVDHMAAALTELQAALRECVGTVWARQLTSEAHQAGVSLGEVLADDVFADIKEAAYRRYFEEITRTP
ncbi:hypothetical protein [Lentzea sp. NBRC 102530]|uniref:hypothetical protein n=1 Tax=Lentzea sp. NBRC 102530 TaxID=3032201 RepID=UPI0024A42E9E|nr:hypothetical protein [Lentzea sp. NBRC 102530]GLY54873.1 hypothetical protein Lesp01_85280 [Lentzea sp. NBRC 102530]